jgi:hypothetical protein
LLKGNNFAKDYQTNSYNKQNLWENNKEVKELLTTFKRHSYLKIDGILKLKKFKELFKMDLEF